jgi:heterodisulfide reductase subunit C2
MGAPAQGHGPLARASIAREIRRLTGTNPAACYQCGKCSAGCPMAAETDLRPHDVMRLVAADREERLASAEALWLCLTCEACTSRCPNGCDPARVIDALRERHGESAPRRIAAFHRSFLDQIRLWGRSYEVGLVMAYKLRTGAFLQDAAAAPGMLAKGKLPLVPHAIAGAAEVRAIFARCAAAAGEDA